MILSIGKYCPPKFDVISIKRAFLLHMLTFLSSETRFFDFFVGINVIDFIRDSETFFDFDPIILCPYNNFARDYVNLLWCVIENKKEKQLIRLNVHCKTHIHNEQVYFVQN